MKKILTLAALIFLLSCKKNDTVQRPTLTGSWEFRGISCYCVRNPTMEDIKPGNGYILSFDNNNNYKRFLKGVLQKSGTYKIVQEKIASSPTSVNRIIYDNDTAAEETFYKIEQNNLTLFGTTPLAADGTETYYAKQ